MLQLLSFFLLLKTIWTIMRKINKKKETEMRAAHQKHDSFLSSENSHRLSQKLSSV